MIKNALGLFIITFVILIIFLPSYTKMQDLRQKNIEYAEQIQQLKKENVLLLEEKNRLNNDPVYLEKIGREKMGIVKEGETMYKIVPMNQEEGNGKKLKTKH